jgi:hypothetical protein
VERYGGGESDENPQSHAKSNFLGVAFKLSEAQIEVTDFATQIHHIEVNVAQIETFWQDELLLIFPEERVMVGVGMVSNFQLLQLHPRPIIAPPSGGITDGECGSCLGPCPGSG